jgi:glucose/arabinose dehydrogenase
MIKCILSKKFTLLLLFNLILPLIFFMGKDVMGAVALPDGFTHELVASGMAGPVGLTFLPDGRILVIEQQGTVRLVVNGILKPDPILDIQAQVRYSNEQGLLGIAVDPEYPTKPFIYLYYTHETENYQHITRFTMTGTLTDPLGTDLLLDPDSSFYLLTDIPRNASNHNGGTLRFGPDGMLYSGPGDDDGYCVAQLRDDLRGVILRMDVSGLPLDNSVRDHATKSEMVPLDNPFASALNENERLVWAYGLRNPFRFSIDSLTGNLFIGDVGWNTYEEISMSVAPGGENFGWPYREGYDSNPSYPTCYGDPEPVDETVEPIGGYYQVSGAYSIIGGGVYHPVNYPFDLSWPSEFDGDYFFADYYQGFLIRLKDQRDGTWAVPPPVSGQPSPEYLITGLSSPSDFTIGPDGAVYYISQWDGNIYKIEYITSGPIPDIKANNSDGPLLIQQGDLLTITVSLDPMDYDGIPADWWVLAAAPFGWYYYDLINWKSGQSVTYQGGLSGLAPYEVLNTSGLPAGGLPLGAYIFYFGVDGNVNGVIDNPLYYDSVEVNITP